MRNRFTQTLGRLLRPFARTTPRLDRLVLERYISDLLANRQRFLDIPVPNGTPAYLVDPLELINHVCRFKEAFEAECPGTKLFYALKSNNHPEIVRTAVDAGCGLDVSSGRELDQVLPLPTNSIVFSGPGKTTEELQRAVAHRSRVTVLIDSFGELDRLDHVASTFDAVVKVGIRLTTDETGIWRKFGIPLAELERFCIEARQRKYIQLKGLQFHLSWDRTPERKTAFIKRLGATLRKLPRQFRQQIEFIDVGGGYWPSRGEWLQPGALPEARWHEADPRYSRPDLYHYALPSDNIERFAREMSTALRTHIPQDVKFAVWTEPGRWLCNDAMHILLTVVDRKGADVVITDGGTNMIGWDRYESDYCPVLNLTRPSLTERSCLIGGSLCTPHDLWGYSYFGEDIRPGDRLLIAHQGAYTYSLRQEFIKPIPQSIVLAPRGKLSQEIANIV